MMRRLQKILATLGILVATVCLSNVEVRADLIYNTEAELIECYSFTKISSTDGSYKLVSSEAGTISYYDADGNLLKVVNKETGEIIINNQDEETTTENETTIVEEATTKEVEEITLPKVKKLSKKTKWSKYKGVKKIDKNDNPVYGKIKYRYGITLTWKRVKGVSGYEIYRYENAAKKWTKIKTIKKNKKKPSYTLTDMLKGENVKIRVRAYKNTKSGKVYGEYSNVIKFKTKHLYTKIYKNARQKSFYSKWASQDAFVIQNKYRKAAGVKPLIWNDVIYDIAVVRAKQCSKDFSHDKFRDTVEDVLCTKYEATQLDAGFISLYSCENIAYGYTTPKNVMNGWKNSEGHYKNILRTGVQIGAIAVYSHSNGNEYWVSIFSSADKDGHVRKFSDGTYYTYDFSFLK